MLCVPSLLRKTCDLQKLKIHRFEAAGYRLLQDPQMHFSKKRDSRTEKGSMISDLTRLPKDYCIAYEIIVFSAGLPLKDLCRDSFYLDFWVFTVIWCQHFGNKNYIGLRQSTSASIFFCKTSICKHTTIELCMCLCIDVSFLGELFQPNFAQRQFCSCVPTGRTGVVNRAACFSFATTPATG